MLFKMEYIRYKIKRNKNKTFQQNTETQTNFVGANHKTGRNTTENFGGKEVG